MNSPRATGILSERSNGAYAYPSKGVDLNYSVSTSAVGNKESQKKPLVKESNGIPSRLYSKKYPKRVPSGLDWKINPKKTVNTVQRTMKEVIDFNISIEALDGITMFKNTIVGTSLKQKKKKRKAANKTMMMNTTKTATSVLGVVSYCQKSGKDGKIQRSNIPSMPLTKTSSSRNKDMYQASFVYPMVGDENNENNENKPKQPFNKNIKFSIVMAKNPKRSSGYDHRQLDLTLGLMRGSEIIKLGIASVPLCGNEWHQAKTVPINSGKMVCSTRLSSRTSSTLSSSRNKSGDNGAVRSAAFESHPDQRYNGNSATLNMSVHAAPRSKHGNGKAETPATTSATTSYLGKNTTACIAQTLEGFRMANFDFQSIKVTPSLYEVEMSVDAFPEAENASDDDESYDAPIGTIVFDEIDAYGYMPMDDLTICSYLNKIPAR